MKEGNLIRRQPDHGLCANAGSCNPALRGLQLPGIFCRQKALFGISRHWPPSLPETKISNNRVAAQTVAAMDAAGHLARSVQAGDDVPSVSSTWRSVSTSTPPMV